MFVRIMNINSLFLPTVVYLVQNEVNVPDCSNLSHGLSKRHSTLNPKTLPETKVPLRPRFEKPQRTVDSDSDPSGGWAAVCVFFLFLLFFFFFV